MNNNLFTVNDIQKRTNLKLDFIRRCTSQMKDILKPYIQNGEFNTLLIDSNGLIIFDKIMQYKEQGLSLPAIKEKLSDLQNPTNTFDKAYNTINNSVENNIINGFITELSKSRESFVSIQNQLTKAYETIIDKEKLIESQKHNLLLLTDGKPPELVKKEFIEREVEFKILSTNNQQLELENKEQKENLNSKLLELSNKDIELQKKNEIIRIKENEINKRNELEEKRKQIIEELNTINNKFFMGKKRKELLKQLQELS